MARDQIQDLKLVLDRAETVFDRMRGGHEALLPENPGRRLRVHITTVNRFAARVMPV